MTKDELEGRRLLSSDDGSDRDSLPPEKKQDDADGSDTAPSRRQMLLKCLYLTLAFLGSVLIGFCLGFQTVRLENNSGRSPYLGLKYSQEDVLWWNTEYSDPNATDAEMDRLWDSTIPWESGIIAMTNEEAEAMGLPDSQPWPWDSNGKRIYIMNAHHLLHCVRNVYISIQQYRADKPQTIPYMHILHCLDSLRVETMCTADDTPRYVPFNTDHGFRPGDGQPRKCRDWSKVEAFVESHDPCYRYLEPGNKDLNNLERFKFCPAGSEYLPIIRGYFGYADDWVPEPQRGPRELEW